MAALAGPARRDQLVVLEGDQVRCGGAVLREEGRAVEADAGLLVDQVGPEAGGEGPLHEERVGAVERRGRHLPVGGCVYACGVHHLALVHPATVSSLFPFSVAARVPEVRYDLGFLLLTVVPEGQALVSCHTPLLLQHQSCRPLRDGSCCRSGRCTGCRTGCCSLALPAVQGARRCASDEGGEDDGELHLGWRKIKIALMV